VGAATSATASGSAPPPGSPARAAQTNDVFVDERGLVYAVDRFTGGLYVIEAHLR
jgi:hypothetical protein